MDTSDRPQGLDFIRSVVKQDLEAGRYAGVVTRFPPEPNGYLHIGHAKSICLNFGIAAEFGGRCHLRFDDTNPETEEVEYVDSIIDAVKWLGFDWGEHLYFASDYFGKMYEFAEHLVRTGHAYVDSLSEEQIREYRGTITEPGRESPYRNRAVEENLDLLRRMKAGEFPDGAHVLRARIDMASRNMLLRDPVLLRIRHAHHYRTGDDWCLYPLYDYAHPLEDALECVTHSICTLEFESNRALYDWVVENCPVPCRPHQYEFARLNLDYTVMSKRRLLQLVNDELVGGWDDPRLPTLAGLRRRGVTPGSIRAFCDLVGVTKADSRVDIGKLDYAVRDDLNRRVPRVLCVLRPLRVVITNYPEGRVEELDAPFYPHDVPLEGARALPFARVLYVERDDFLEQPPRGWHRLAPGAEVRLRYAYIIRCEQVVKDEHGDVVELRCTYDPATRGGAAPEGRTIRGTLHWVSAEHALPCEVRLYDRLFTVADPDAGPDDFKSYLNPDSLVVLKDARIEPGVRDDPPGTRYQFERQGYFCSDPVDSRPDALVFNRTVTLRDTWSKAAAKAEPAPAPERKATPESAPPPREAAAAAEARPRAFVRAPELEARRLRFMRELDLGEPEADTLTRDAALADLFEGVVGMGIAPRSAANWIVNDFLRETREQGVAELAFDAPAFAELVRMVEAGIISSSAGKEVLAELVSKGGGPAEIVERRGLRQLSNPDALRPAIDEAIEAYPQKVEQYRAGRTGLLGFFVGQVIARTGGRANPELVRRLLAERLG